MECFNTAVYVTPARGIVGYYDKLHLVVFGEYVPFADYFPWLQRLTPLPVAATPGKRPAGFLVGGYQVAPNICFESVLPHVIRRQVNFLRAEGRDPDLLVNLTNDGWFWGSSEQEMHLACGVFRAVECRKPFLAAANTGISAWIDGDGRIRRTGPAPCLRHHPGRGPLGPAAEPLPRLRRLVRGHLPGRNGAAPRCLAANSGMRLVRGHLPGRNMAVRPGGVPAAGHIGGLEKAYRKRPPPAPCRLVRQVNQRIVRRSLTYACPTRCL